MVSYTTPRTDRDPVLNWSSNISGVALRARSRNIWCCLVCPTVHGFCRKSLQWFKELSCVTSKVANANVYEIMFDLIFQKTQRRLRFRVSVVCAPCYSQCYFIADGHWPHGLSSKSCLMEVWISTRKFNRETQLEHRYIHPCRTCISTHPCIHATSLSSLQHQFSPNDSCSRQQPMALRMNWNQVVLTILSGASPPLSVTRLNKHMHRPSISASSSNGARSEPALLVVAITCYLGGKAVAETANASTKIRRCSRGWWS